MSDTPQSDTPQPDVPRSDVPRSIDLSIEVPGTPEEVWRAIATGPGISSWYVPHRVEERAGGTATASFGPGPEMQIDGRVAAWEPPRRIVFDDGEGKSGLAFEWLVEARDGGSCVVRLVNTGFGDGGEWDDQYDALHEGWQLFLLSLRLHLEHFRGRDGAAAMPTGVWAVDAQKAWDAVAAGLRIPSTLGVGDRLDLDGGHSLDGEQGLDAETGLDGERAAHLAGTVVDVAERRVALLVDEPAPGIAFVVAETHGPVCSVSVWAYLYGDDRESLASDLGAAWQRWLDAHNPSPG